MHDLRGLCSEKRPSLARCSPDASSNGALQGILNTWGAYLAKISSFWIHGGDILPRKGVFPVRDSFGNALGRYFARNPPPRLLGVRLEGASFKGCAFICPKWASKKFRPGMHPFAIRKCTSKMLRLGPFGCAGEREMIIAVFSLRQSVSSVPWGSGRCGAAEFRVLDVAVDAMAVERAEHERVQVQVQVRARMPLLPPALQGFGRRLRLSRAA